MNVADKWSVAARILKVAALVSEHFERVPQMQASPTEIERAQMIAAKIERMVKFAESNPRLALREIVGALGLDPNEISRILAP